LLPPHAQLVHDPRLGIGGGSCHLAAIVDRGRDMNATVSPSRQIVQTVRGMPASDGAGVKLNRVIGSRRWTCSIRS